MGPMVNPTLMMLAGASGAVQAKKGQENPTTPMKKGQSPTTPAAKGQSPTLPLKVTQQGTTQGSKAQQSATSSPTKAQHSPTMASAAPTAAITPMKTAAKPEKKTNEEEKVSATKKGKGHYVPWIDASQAQSLLMSPGMSPEAVRLPNVRCSEGPSEQGSTSPTNLLKSPSLYLREPRKDSSKGVVYCECGNPCSDGTTQCVTCFQAQQPIEYTGYLYLKSKTKVLKKYWFSLLNKELYCKGGGEL